MARGRKTGGRRKGVPNKRTVKRREALAQVVEQLVDQIPDRFRGDAHEFLRVTYSDPRLPLDIRLDAAKAAIRFEKPSLTASHVEVSHTPKQRTLQQLSTVQLIDLLKQMDAEERRTINGSANDVTALPAPEPSQIEPGPPQDPPERPDPPRAPGAA